MRGGVTAQRASIDRRMDLAGKPAVDACARPHGPRPETTGPHGMCPLHQVEERCVFFICRTMCTDIVAFPLRSAIPDGRRGEPASTACRIAATRIWSIRVFARDWPGDWSETTIVDPNSVAYCGKSQCFRGFGTRAPSCLNGICRVLCIPGASVVSLSLCPKPGSGRARLCPVSLPPAAGGHLFRPSASRRGGPVWLPGSVCTPLATNMAAFRPLDAFVNHDTHTRAASVRPVLMRPACRIHPAPWSPRLSAPDHHHSERSPAMPHRQHRPHRYATTPPLPALPALRSTSQRHRNHHPVRTPAPVQQSPVVPRQSAQTPENSPHCDKIGGKPRRPLLHPHRRRPVPSRSVRNRPYKASTDTTPYGLVYSRPKSLQPRGKRR
jgi:hypothetical protein